METLDNQVFNTGGNTSPEVNREIESLHPWMRLTAILQMVVLGISLIANLATAFMMPFGTEYQLVQAIIGLIIWIFPLVFLLQSAAAFKDYLATHNPQSLLWALTKQKAFWRYMGILIIVIVCLVILAIIIGVVVGGSMMRGF